MSKFTFKEFQAEYPDDAACLAKLMEVNYGGTEITCPACGVEKAQFHAMNTRKAFACQECGHHIYPCAGTIFHKSKTPLTKWFFAMYLLTSTRSGVAAKELERALGVTYKCAWRMAHELRKLMTSADYGGPLKGHVEIDETWVGGVRRKGGKGSGKRQSKKTIIMGMVERDGMLRAGPVPDDTQFTLEPVILENVKLGSTITTDGHLSYSDLKSSYDHTVINHAAGEYARGIHHTNTIEGHWSQLKRSIKGTHTFTFRQSTLGNILASSTTAAITELHTTECSFALFLLSRCRVYKRREILSVIGVCIVGSGGVVRRRQDGILS